MVERGELVERLEKALADHLTRSGESWSGPYHFAAQNDEIEACRMEADRWLRERDLWPRNAVMIDNARCIALLKAGETQ